MSEVTDSTKEYSIPVAGIMPACAAEHTEASDSAETAAKTRLRRIVMTSLAFIIGVIPLLIAKGAGADMRQSLGTTVFSGMLGVTIFGLIFTPVFYVLTRQIKLPSLRLVVRNGYTFTL